MISSRTGGAIAGLSFFIPLCSGAAFTQEQPQRLRGTIERIEGGVLAIKTREGMEVTVKLKENAPVTAVVPASLSDVAPGVYIGVTGRPQPGGGQRAVEVHIFPETMRGLGEGHRPGILNQEAR